MRKGIIATLVLFLISLSIVLLSFSMSGRSSYSESARMPFLTNTMTDIEEEDDRVFIRHRISPANPEDYARRFIGKSFNLKDAGDLIGNGGVKMTKRVSMTYDDVLVQKEETPYLFYGNGDTADSQKIDAKIKEAEIATPTAEDAVVKLSIDRDAIFRYEPLTLSIAPAKEKPQANELEIYVRRAANKQLRANGDGRVGINLHAHGNGYKAVYMHPFGGSIGDYEFVVYYESKGVKRVYAKPFYVKGRAVPPVDRTLAVATMEYNLPIGDKKIPLVNGGTGDYHAFYDWVRQMNSDTFWVLGGQTTGWDASITPKKVWGSIPIRNIELFGESKNKKDVKLGAYVMSYFTPGYGNQNAGYTISLTYGSSGIQASRHISLSCRKRLADIIDLLKRFQDNKNVSYVGLDFIRTGEFDGFEMADEMVSITGAYTPSGWQTMKLEDKVVWLANEVVRSKEMLSKWRWFRAHKAAMVVKQIRDAGITKPLWVFTLGWNHGVEHGQDPYMFFDAGVDIDAVMLYEATRDVYSQMMVHWPAYLSGNYNVLVGNMIDKRLLDGSELAQLEYARRYAEACQKLNRNNRVRGVFFHDVSRMLWSKFRATDINEWAYINASVVSRMREKYGETMIQTSLDINDESGEGVLTINNLTGNAVEGIEIQPYGGWELKGVFPAKKRIEILAGNEKLSVPFTYGFRENMAGSKSMIAFRVILPGGEASVVFVYTNAKRPRALVSATSPSRS